MAVSEPAAEQLLNEGFEPTSPSPPPGYSPLSSSIWLLLEAGWLLQDTARHPSIKVDKKLGHTGLVQEVPRDQHMGDKHWHSPAESCKPTA